MTTEIAYWTGVQFVRRADRAPGRTRSQQSEPVRTYREPSSSCFQVIATTRRHLLPAWFEELPFADGADVRASCAHGALTDAGQKIRDAFEALHSVFPDSEGAQA